MCGIQGYDEPGTHGTGRSGRFESPVDHALNGKDRVNYRVKQV